MAAAGGYSFPILSNGDIIACINELGIGYTEAQLIKPNPTEVPSLILTPLLTVSWLFRTGQRQHAGPDGSGPSMSVREPLFC
jgi:hypothetical protein